MRHGTTEVSERRANGEEKSSFEQGSGMVSFIPGVDEIAQIHCYITRYKLHNGLDFFADILKWEFDIFRYHKEVDLILPAVALACLEGFHVLDDFNLDIERVMFFCEKINLGYRRPYYERYKNGPANGIGIHTSNMFDLWGKHLWMQEPESCLDEHHHEGLSGKLKKAPHPSKLNRIAGGKSFGLRSMGSSTKLNIAAASPRQPNDPDMENCMCPYHNALHAADVVQALCVFVNQEHFPLLSPIDFLSLWFAGLIHDYDHPGVNNKFLIVTEHPISLVYNDLSVLENFHAATSFHVLLTHNFMDFLKREEYLSFKHHVVEMVLATDLGHHFDFVKKMDKELKENDGKLSVESTLAAAIKSADISHPLRELHIHEEWSNRISAEFYAQGDLERDLNLPVICMMDRNDKNASIGKSQMGYISFVVKPLLTPWSQLIKMDVLMENCDENFANWKALQETEATMADSLH